MQIAIIKNGKVENIVIGEYETVSVLFDLVQPITEETGIAWIGAKFNGEKFEPIKIYESWAWNESEFTYEPPTAKPDGDYYWDEAELDWLIISAPQADPEPEPAPE